MLIVSFASAALIALAAAGTAAAASAAEAKVDNPLLAPWTGPYGGVPPFDKVEVGQFKPALEASMADALAEIDRIANDAAAPTFENTIAALERSGRALDRASNVFGVYSSTMSTPDFQKVEEEMAPKLAAFSDQITQNEKLFARIAAVYDARENSGLTPEQKRLVWLDYTNFVRAGAEARSRGQEARGRDQPAPGLALHEVQPEPPRRRDGLRAVPGQGVRPFRPARVAARRGRRRGRGARPEGQMGHHEHALEHGAVPHLFGPARPAREGVAARTTAAATTATPTTTTRSSPRS